MSVETHPAITDLFVQPDVRRHRITVSVETTGPGEIAVSIEGTNIAFSGESGAHIIDFPDYTPWTPASPMLYTLRCTFAATGHEPVEAATRFGMRELTLRENRFYLNNHPLFIKGIFHKPEYPVDSTPRETSHLARNEVERAKEAGFNFVRLAGRATRDAFLDAADELGLLVCSEVPNAEDTDSCFEDALRTMILRDRNHPSVVAWGLFELRSDTPRNLRNTDFCTRANAFDPSRISIGALSSSPAHMLRPYGESVEAFDDLRVSLRAPVDRVARSYLENVGNHERLSFICAFGYGRDADAYSIDDKTEHDALREAGRALQADSARFQAEAFRTNAQIAGYCYSRLCDGANGCRDGILNTTRQPKPAFETFRSVQRAATPIIHVATTNLVPRQEVPVTVTLVNDARLEGRGEVVLQVVGPTNQVLWKKKRGVKIPRSGKELWSGAVSASGSPGVHKLDVRLMRETECLAESTLEFSVFNPTKPSEVDIHLLDPAKEWGERCGTLATLSTIHAPVHIIPPIANTIRAYPDNNLAQIMSQVHEGAVALFFSPPSDWNDFADLINPEIRATRREASVSSAGLCHFNEIHPVFDGLPTGGVMRQPYRNLAAPRTFVENSEENIVTTMDSGAGIQSPEDSGSDVLVRRYGSGRIVFTHMPILEHLGRDPVADHLFVNIVRHFSRRAVPSGGTLKVHQHSVEWLRRERAEHVRRWMVIGMFSNWDNEGHEFVYPPESHTDFTATYPGWYRAISWRNWFSTADDAYGVELDHARETLCCTQRITDHGTGYAFAELIADDRGDVVFTIKSNHAAKIWLNGSLIYSTRCEKPRAESVAEDIEAFVKQGRNTVLVKVSTAPGKGRFSFEVASPSDSPHVAWWR